MNRRTLFSGAILLAAGIGIGIFAARIGHHDAHPLSGERVLDVHASASCFADGVTLATGSYDPNVEVLYYLDSQSGRLSAGLLSRSTPGFVKTFTRNLKADLLETVGQLGLTVPHNTSFIMVTGESDLRNMGGAEMNNTAKSFVYVAELNTGIVLVYVLPREGDRDATLEWENFLFWTAAKLNSGQSAPPSATPPRRRTAGPAVPESASP